jgi:membrane fusion protein, multidrug efflux system
MTDESPRSDRPDTTTPRTGAPSAPPARPASRRRNLIAIVVVVLVAAALAWILTPHGPKDAPGGRGGRGGDAAAGPGGGGAGGPGGGRGGRGRRPATTVGTAKAVLGAVPIEINALGAVTPNATVTVRSQLSGTLLRVYFREGQMVRQGQVLAQVDPRPYQIALQQAQAALLRDQAALANSRVDLQRYRTLLAQDSIAAQQVDTQAALVKQNEALVASDRATVAAANLNLVYTDIRAPISGRVGLRQVDVGNLVSTGDANGIVVLAEVDPIGVIFSIPEDAAPQIMQRFAKNATLPVTAYDRSGATVIETGTLSTLDNQVDPDTGTVKAKALFANTNGLLLPQQFVNVRILVDTLTGVVTIPAAAVRHGPQGDYVFVLQPDKTAKVVQVKVGPSLGEVASIASGVQPGDTVITEGGDQLRDGSRVVLPGDRPQARERPRKGGLFGWLGTLFGGGKDDADPAGRAAGRGERGARGEAGQGGQGRGGGQRMAQLEAALDLDAAQKTKAQQIFADARTEAMASNGDDPDARRAAMREANDKAFARLEPILRPDQKAKLPAARAAMQQRRGGGGGQGSSGG